MEFEITAVSKICMSHKKGTTQSQMHESKFYLEVSKNLDKSKYLDGIEEAPTKEGCKVMLFTFIAGIGSLVKYAHSKGYENEADLMRLITNELNKFFVSIPSEIKHDIF